MSILFSPFSLREITLKNRIVVSPMCQYSSIDGFSNDWHLVHLGSRAVGGAGLVFTEATAVSPEGRISPEDLGIYKDEHIPGLKRITKFIEDNGSVAGIQLAHAGRKASHTSPWKGGLNIPADQGGWKPVGPSKIPFNEGDTVPDALNEDGIQKVITDFGQAASRALEAGFKVVEIHAAHGYLLHEFYSPYCNDRNDQYGGSYENRTRLLLEVVRKVREVWPISLPLFVRLSVTEWVEGQWSVEDSVKLSKTLADHQVDLIDCSTGGNIPGVKIPLEPGYQVPCSHAVKLSGIPTGAVGLIHDPFHAEEILSSGKADLIFMAREHLRDPYFALHAAQKLNEEVNWPNQYLRAKK